MFRRNLGILMSFILLFALFFSSIPSQMLQAKSIQPPKRFLLTSVLLHQNKSITRKLIVSLHFDAADLSYVNTNQGLLIRLKNGDNLNIPNQPALPCVRKDVQLFQNEQIVSIRTIKAETIKLPLPTTDIRFAEPPHEISNSPMTDPMESFSQSNPTKVLPAFFPTVNFDYVQTENRFSKNLSLLINPVYIDGKFLVLMDHMEIEVSLYSDILTPSGRRVETKPRSIILTPDELLEAANKLKTIHEKDGYEVVVKTLSTFADGEESPKPVIDGVVGFLDAASDVRLRIASFDNPLARKIQYWLKGLTDSEKIQYLTIMGDATYVPPSYYVFSPDNRDSYDRWIPTDIFYSAPGAEGKNFPVLISVGRLPVRDLEEANQVVGKIEKYRATLDPEWFRNADIMAGDPFNGDFFGELSTTRAINSNFLEGLAINRYYKSEGKFTTEPFMKAMKENKHGFVWGFGHGGGDGLALEPGYITSKHIVDLPEKTGLPIFLSEACGNGAFDSRLIKATFSTNSSLKHPTSFSEAIVTSKGGGIAYVGGARVNYAGWNMIYEQGIPNLIRVYYMDAILEYFMENYHNQAGALGDISRKTLELYAQRDWFGVNAPLVKTFFGYTLQGDPTLKIPFFSNPKKRKVPEIQPDETKPTDASSIPLYSIDDGSKVKVNSDSESLYYILCDYDNSNKPVKISGKFDPSTKGAYQRDFSEFSKTRMTIRVGTDDGKENRIVFHGRYNHDLVMKKPYDIELLEKNEQKSYYAKIHNDGIFEAKDIKVTVTDNDKIISETTFPSIPILSSRYIYYSFQTGEEGLHQVLVQTPAQEGETAKSDNLVSNAVTVTGQKNFRIGVLNDSPQLDRSYYEGRLMLTELNKKLRDLNHNLEICIVPLGRDENGKTSIDRLNLDAVMLYSTDFYTYPMAELLAELEKFEKQGGMIFGVLCLGQNAFGIDLVDIQSYFGISEKERFLLYRTDEKTKTFQFYDDYAEEFPQPSYEITSRYALLPKDKNWSSIEMEEGEIVGTDKDNHYALIKNKNRYLFTGFLADKDFKKDDQSLEFFIDLLLQIKKMPIDLRVDKVDFNPPIGRKNNNTEVTVLVRNNSLIEVNQVKVLLNRTQSEVIDSIPAKSTAKVSYQLNWQGISGNQGVQIEVNSEKGIIESDYSNNIYKTAYFVAEKGEPNVPPVLAFATKDKEVVSMSNYLITGTATPGSTVRMNLEEIALNQDGSFQQLVELKPGKNQFLFSVHQGSLYGQEMIFEVTYQPFVSLLLKIGDSQAVLDKTMIALESPPFIKAGSTFVPLRFISDAFGAKINFIAKPNQEIQINYQGATIYLWINKASAKIIEKDGIEKEIKLTSSPVIVKGRTFVPLRFIAEAFGASVNWIAATESIQIQIPKNTPNTEEKTFFKEEEKKEPGYIASSKKEGKIVSPSCVDRWEDVTYVSMYDGIYGYDAENQQKTFIPWDLAFIDAISEEGLRNIASTPNRGFFRMNETNIFISDTRDIYVLENPSGKYLYRINATEYKNYAEPLHRFGFIQDMEVSGNQLFVLNPYDGISVIDLTNRELSGVYGISNYPWDMTIYDGKIYACLLYGGITSLNLDGSGTKSFYFEGDMYCNTLSVNDEGVFYLNTYFPENNVYRFTMTPTFTMLDPVSLSGTVGSFLERMVISNKQYYAISYNDRSLGTLGIDTKFVLVDENLKLSTDFGKEDTKEVSKNGSFIANPNQVWLTESSECLVSLQYPSNINIVRYYDETGLWIRDIKVNLDEFDAEYRGVTYAGSNTLGVLYKKKTFFIQKYVFSKEDTKVKSETVALKMKYGSLNPSTFVMTEEVIAVFDNMTGKVILFDAKSGLEKDRVSLAGNENYASLHGAEKMVIKYNKLYVMDTIDPIITVFSLDDHLIEAQVKILSYQLPVFPNRFDFKVSAENILIVMDGALSKFYQITDGIITDSWGDKMFIPVQDKNPNLLYQYWNPTSFDLREGKYVVNDLGNQRIIAGRYPREILLPPADIQSNVEKIEASLYQNKPFSVLLEVQILDSQEMFTLQVPDWVSVSKFDSLQRSLVVELTILANRLTPGTPMEGTIIIQCGTIKKEIPIQAQRKLNQIIVKHQSGFILSQIDPYISKYPVLIEKKVLLLPTSVLSDLFDMMVNEQKNKVILTVGTLIIEIDTVTSKAQLITSVGKSAFDLKGKVKIVKGAVYLPMSGIFELLGKKISIEDTKGSIEY